MLRNSLPFALTALLLCLSACSDPKCPHTLIQHGSVCSHCPEGSVKRGNQCVDGDGGLVEPVEVDQDAEIDDGADAETQLDADADDGGALDADGDDSSAPSGGQYALGTAGAPCGPELEQSLACEGHASRKTLKCQGGSWQVLQTCAQSERCESRVGTEQGTCAAIPAACVGKSAGPICDGTVRLECGIDLVNVVSRPCPEHTHCDAMSATCACDTGYQDDGKGGCVNPDNCPSDACKGGKCVDGADDYSCNCDSGYAGTGTKKCSAVLYCPKDACTPGGSCVDTMNWSCQCNTGFTGTGTQACSNQNDCPSDRCKAPNGICQDLVGSYKCTCNAGFSGTDCVNDVCAPNPCRNGGTCSRTGKLCACPTGYSGTNCEVDACNPNPCQHGGACTRTSSGAMCNCAGTGYQGNQCETKIDPCSGATNACGGSCMTPLAHQPNESCDNGLLGACKKTGKYVCQGTSLTLCNAPSATAANEVCGDGVDNDCDGTTDEDDASDATTWYQDCDGDGYSPLTEALVLARTGVLQSCTKPVVQNGCGWTALRPQAPKSGIAPMNWDCDDNSIYYRPGADFDLPPAGKTRVDLNCDNVNEKQNAVGVPSFTGGGFDSFPRCATTASCLQCGVQPSGSRVVSAQWTTAGQPTDTQPPCSVSATNVYPYRSNAGFQGSCDEQSWPLPEPGAVQKCK